MKSKGDTLLRHLLGDDSDDTGSATYDFAFLHVKAVDDASHEGDVMQKVAYPVRLSRGRKEKEGEASVDLLVGPIH